MRNNDLVTMHSPQADLFIEVCKYLDIGDSEDRNALISELKEDYGIKDIYHFSSFETLSDWAAFELFREIKQKQYYKMGYFEEEEE